MKCNRILRYILFTCCLLFLTSPANAVNVVSNGGFNDGEITYADTYNGIVGAWLTDGYGFNAWTIVYGETYGGAVSEYAQSGVERSSMYQVIHFNGAAGAILVDYFQNYNPGGLGIEIYGAYSRPATGSSWEQETWTDGVCPFGEYIYGRITSGPAGWREADRDIQADDSFEYYTIRFFGEYSSYWDQYAAIDSLTFDISPSAVPVPGTLILLGVGIIGLAGVRKKRKK